MKGIERMEELFLQTFPTFEKLDVVDEKDIDFAIPTSKPGHRV